MYSPVSRYYDYTNKRRRIDFHSGSMQGQTKVYRYDVNDFGHEPFPAPRGYQFETNSPTLTCCWTWLIDSSDPSNSTNER